MSGLSLLVAGEASGDLYGAMLLEELRGAYPGWNFTAFGGRKMEAAGAELLYPLAEEGVIGLWEALVRLPRYWRAWRALCRFLDEHRPNPVILIDYPGFNMRVAAFARKLGLDAIYVIPPKVWVWKARRARQLARDCSLIVTIFPFEPPLYRRHEGNAVYCGHPVVDVYERSREAGRTRYEQAGDTTGKILALLPGSRRQEVDRLLPRFLGAAAILKRQGLVSRVVIPRAATIPRGAILEIAASSGVGDVEISEEPVAVVLDGAGAAIAASGTVTLEAALAGVPMVIAYAVNPVSAVVYDLFVRSEFIGLPNIVAGRRICPELLQGKATARALAAQTARILVDGPERRDQERGLAEVRASLGDPGAMARMVSHMDEYFRRGATKQ